MLFKSSPFGVMDIDKFDKDPPVLANQQPSIVAIDGCGSSHYWERYAEQFGHDVRVISSKKEIVNFS